MKRTFAITTALAMFASSASAQEFGTIKGRLVWGGTTIPAPVPLDNSKEAFCSKNKQVDQTLVIDSATKGVANAFAYLPKPVGKNAEAESALLAKEPKVAIDNKDCEFVPHSTALHQKQTVVFSSSDPVGHNSHYSGFTNSKNVALPAMGKVEEKLVKEARLIPLKCDIHPWMKGNIMVFDHPFFAVTKEDGSFEIKGVPAGTQNMIVLQERSGFVTEGGGKGMAVKVEAGKTTDVGDIILQPSKVKP